MKLKFKTVKPTGKWRSFENPSHYIMDGKISFGNIDAETFKIRLQIIKDDIMEDGNKNCIWKWITLRQESKTLVDAQEFVRRHIDIIQSKYKLYIHE